MNPSINLPKNKFFYYPEQGTNKKKRKVPTTHQSNPYHLNPTEHHRFITSPQGPTDPIIPFSTSSNHSTITPLADQVIQPYNHAQQHVTATQDPTLPFRFHSIHVDPKTTTYTNPATDSLALAQILSSHHVKMKMRPISSPRHYGRHLHKITLSRTLTGKPNSEHSATKSTPSPTTPSKSITTPPTKSKVGKKKLTPSPQQPQPKRTSKRQVSSSFNSKHRSPSALIKSKNNHLLKLPILPNLYDPSLKIDQIPTTPACRFAPSTSSASSFPLHPTTRSSSLPDLPPQKKIDFPDGYNGQFTFKLEMVEVTQRLAGLHLAISADKRNRIVQIQEAMKIAMEKVGRSSMGGPEGAEGAPQPGLAQSSDDRYLEPDSLKNTRMASDHLSTTSITQPIGRKNHNDNKSRSSMITTDSRGRYSNAHGPSGPPPSEPPPPLPSQQPLNNTNKSVTSSAQVTDTEDNSHTRRQPPKKNQQQKGKKRRSAHANANNIHHRDNYVPSRLPNRYQVGSYPGSSTEYLSNSTKNPLNHNNNDWSGLNLLAHDQFEDPSGGSNEFVFIDPNLSLLLGPLGTGSGHSPKNNKKAPKSEHESLNKQPPAGQHCQLGRSPISRFFVEQDEWICGFCEYQLWFGDEISLIKVIKNRKEVLRRRRRAKERAANGVNNVKNVNNNQSNSNNANATSNNKNATQNLKSLNSSTGDNHIDQKSKKKIVAAKASKKHKDESIPFESIHRDQFNDVHNQVHEDNDNDYDQVQHFNSPCDQFDEQIDDDPPHDNQDQEQFGDVNDLVLEPSSLFSCPKPTHSSPSLPSLVALPAVPENH